MSETEQHHLSGQRAKIECKKTDLMEWQCGHNRRQKKGFGQKEREIEIRGCLLPALPSHALPPTRVQVPGHGGLEKFENATLQKEVLTESWS